MRTLQDVQKGEGKMRQHRGIQLAALITLVVGIGADISAYHARHSVRMRLFDVRPGAASRRVISHVKYPDWKSRNHVFGDSVAVTGAFRVNLTGAGEPEELVAAGATADFFRMIGVKPAIGRTFLPLQDAGQHGRVVILSHQLWQRRFASDRGIIGKSITLDGKELQVVGVLPPDFTWNDRQTDVWVPYFLAPNQDEGSTGGRNFRSAAAGVLRDSRRNQCG